jgi:hypothetical protein
MAVLKPLRIKEKTYIFKVFGNEKSKNPAKAVFKRFPLSDELFPIASQKSVMESITFEEIDNTPEAKEKLVKIIIDTMIENISSNQFDYERFLKECIDSFEDFQYGEDEIKSVDDFLKLPLEAVQKITKDLYSYSKVEDSFTISEKKFKYRLPLISDGIPEDRE